MAKEKYPVTGISVIVPALDEEHGIETLLNDLAPLRARGHELIVVDGGSSDATVDRARPLADVVLVSERGRARQMNAGARLAKGDVLWFVHADTRPTAEALACMQGLDCSQVHWGRFDVRIAGLSRWLPIIAWSMNARSRLTGIATGDQGIFVSRRLFEAVGAFPCIALMEDVAISRRLKRLARPRCFRARLVTSGRRWDANGPWRTILLMWRLRLAYFLGTDPSVLARRYR